LHKNALGGWAHPGPAGELYRSSRTSSRYKGKGREEIGRKGLGIVEKGRKGRERDMKGKVW